MRGHQHFGQWHRPCAVLALPIVAKSRSRIPDVWGGWANVSYLSARFASVGGRCSRQLSNTSPPFVRCWSCWLFFCRILLGSGSKIEEVLKIAILLRRRPSGIRGFFLPGCFQQPFHKKSSWGVASHFSAISARQNKRRLNSLASSVIDFVHVASWRACLATWRNLYLLRVIMSPCLRPKKVW